jgi:hypothetical protein
LLQTVQVGCSRSTTPLFFWYSGLWCALAMCTPCCASARWRACCQLVVIVLHVGLGSVVLFCFVCHCLLWLDLSAISPPSPASRDTHCFNRLPDDVLPRASSTHVAVCYQPPCNWLRSCSLFSFVVRQ